MPSSSAGKKSAAKRRKQESSRLPIPLAKRHPTEEGVFLRDEDYPADAICFCPITDEDMPNDTMPYLRSIVSGNYAEVYDVLLAITGAVFIIRHDKDKKQRLFNFMKSDILVPGTNYQLTSFRNSVKNTRKTLENLFPAPDAIFSDTDFSVPDSSSEDERPHIVVKPIPLQPFTHKVDFAAVKALREPAPPVTNTEIPSSQVLLHQPKGRRHHLSSLKSPKSSLASPNHATNHSRDAGSCASEQLIFPRSPWSSRLLCRPLPSSSSQLLKMPALPNPVRKHCTENSSSLEPTLS